MVFVDMRKIIITEMLNRCNLEEKVIVRYIFVYSEKISRDWYTRLDFIRIRI